MYHHIFVIDLDETLIIRGHYPEIPGQKIYIRLDSLPGSQLRQFTKHPEFVKLEELLRTAISKGHEVWILTASFFYTINVMEQIFSPYLRQKMRFFNGADMAKLLNFPYPRSLTENANFKVKRSDIFMRVATCKGDFLKEMLMPLSIQNPIKCILYDDSLHQCENAKANNSQRIQISSYRVTDFSSKVWSDFPIRLKSDIRSANIYVSTLIPILSSFQAATEEYWRRMQFY